MVRTTKEPLMIKCFQCKKEFSIKWVISQRNYSQKNDLNYWTEEKGEKKRICNECLKEIYEENGVVYKSFNPKKKNLFRVYLSSGKFN